MIKCQSVKWTKELEWCFSSKFHQNWIQNFLLSNRWTNTILIMELIQIGWWFQFIFSRRVMVYLTFLDSSGWRSLGNLQRFITSSLIISRIFSLNGMQSLLKMENLTSVNKTPTSSIQTQVLFLMPIHLLNLWKKSQLRNNSRLSSQFFLLTKLSKLSRPEISS